jgi:DtxR family Mn-dependent transcriptional regulator
MVRQQNINKLSSSLENYLETIALLKRENKYARISTIAKNLNVKNSSANAAIKFLAESGLVMHERYGYVDLTPQGQQIADEIQRKHDVLYQFLNEVLSIDKETALLEACEIEHSVSAQTAAKLEKLYFFLKKRPLELKNLKKLF